jgi:hypothetical protein
VAGVSRDARRPGCMLCCRVSAEATLRHKLLRSTAQHSRAQHASAQQSVPPLAALGGRASRMQRHAGSAMQAVSCQQQQPCLRPSPLKPHLQCWCDHHVVHNMPHSAHQPARKLGSSLLISTAQYNTVSSRVLSAHARQHSRSKARCSCTGQACTVDTHPLIHSSNLPPTRPSD